MQHTEPATDRVAALTPDVDVHIVEDRERLRRLCQGTVAGQRFFPGGDQALADYALDLIALVEKQEEKIDQIYWVYAGVSPSERRRAKADAEGPS